VHALYVPDAGAVAGNAFSAECATIICVVNKNAIQNPQHPFNEMYHEPTQM
jgi:hypothetical protein